MSLEEFPLHLILIANVEVGLDGDDGLGILFADRGSFILDVHGEWSRCMEAVEGGRADELGGKRIGPTEVYISRRHHTARQFTTEIRDSRHPRSAPEGDAKAPLPVLGVYWHLVNPSYWNRRQNERDGTEQLIPRTRALLTCVHLAAVDSDPGDPSGDRSSARGHGIECSNGDQMDLKTGRKRLSQKGNQPSSVEDPDSKRRRSTSQSATDPVTLQADR